MANWFYTIGDQQLGPVPDAELRALARAGTINTETHVWKEGLADWIPAGRLKGLLPSTNAPAGLAGASAGPMMQSEMQAGATQAGPTLLSYANAPVETALETAPAALPEFDAGPFFKIGGQFMIAKQSWVGPVVASPTAIYMLKQRRLQSRSYGAGGLVGLILAAALSGDDLTRTCDITELPPNVRAQLDRKGKRDKGDVLILKRDAMRLVKTSSFFGRITPHIGDEKFPITPGLFKMKKARAFLGSTGWTLDYPMTPTAAPTHGKAYGLDEQTTKKRKMKARVRIVLTLLVILFFIALGVLNAMSHPHR